MFKPVLFLFLLTLNANSLFAAEITVPAAAPAPAPDITSVTKLATIGVVDGEASEEMSIVNIRFDQKPSFDKIEIEDHETFLQLNLPNTIAPQSGEFIDVKSPFVKKVAVFQISPTISAVRIFVEKDAAIIKAASEAEILNNRLVITTSHNQILAATKGKVQKEKKIEAPASPENVVGSVTTQKALQEINASTNLAKSKFDMKDKLYKVAGFLGVMLVFLIIVLSIKPVLDRKKRARLGENYTPMKLLGDLAITPKQKLSLVQIGNEQILISVSPEQINFIQKIGENKPRLSDQIGSMRDSLNGPQFISPVNENRVNRSAPKQLNFTVNEDADLFEKKSGQSSGNTKNIESNQKSKSSSKKINLKIDDDGISSVSSRREKESTENSKSIEDVTRIIREKLKNLPNI